MDTTIKLPNGRTAVSFVPEDSKELAIVPLSVIQQLCKDMPRANIREHKRQLIAQIDETETIEQMVKITEDFTNFHQTVNLIANYDPNENTITPVEPEYLDR